jgi:hypothetical protein
MMELQCGWMIVEATILTFVTHEMDSFELPVVPTTSYVRVETAFAFGLQATFASLNVKLARRLLNRTRGAHLRCRQVVPAIRTNLPRRMFCGDNVGRIASHTTPFFGWISMFPDIVKACRTRSRTELWIVGF